MVKQITAISLAAGEIALGEFAASAQVGHCATSQYLQDFIDRLKPKVYIQRYLLKIARFYRSVEAESVYTAVASRC
jgi:hypothetical protein